MIWHHHHPDVYGLVAIGARGVYSIVPMSHTWILSGIGHDGLPILDLPADGKEFASLTDALNHAEWVDLRREAELSGT